MDGIFFANGLSGISTLQKELSDSDFPRQKSAFKPSGDHVVAYIWRALDYGKTFEHREMRFALNLQNYNQVLSPDEHSLMTLKAIKTLKQHDQGIAEIRNALLVLEEAMALRTALQMSRNALHAA